MSRELSDVERTILLTLEPCELIDLIMGFARIPLESMTHEGLICMAIVICSESLVDQPQALQTMFGGPFIQDWKSN